MAKTILAIGGHIGDACLTAGGVMAANAVDGGKNYTLALTAGEKGNPPTMSTEEYKIQKINEAKAFMEMMNGEAFVFEYGDGELEKHDEVVRRVAEIIVQTKPNVIITHWSSKMHKDHHNTHLIVKDAQFMASVVGTKYGRHYAELYFAENWEDDLDFKPYVYVDITKGYELWCEALHKHWFVMNSKDFAYYDYYTSLARCRGALCKKQYAECFDIYDYKKKVVKDSF